MKEMHETTISRALRDTICLSSVKSRRYRIDTYTAIKCLLQVLSSHRIIAQTGLRWCVYLDFHCACLRQS